MSSDGTRPAKIAERIVATSIWEDEGIQIDNDARASEADDGVWVEAWVFVSNDEIRDHMGTAPDSAPDSADDYSDEIIRVWRGQSARFPPGTRWTTDEESALRAAIMYFQNPCVMWADVRRGDALFVDDGVVICEPKRYSMRNLKNESLT